VTPQQAENRGLAWVLGAFVLCPCHLPLTLWAAAAMLSGTVAGVLLREHVYVAGIAITAVWAAATWRGVRYFRAAGRVCDQRVEAGFQPAQGALNGRAHAGVKTTFRRDI
jgi:hypothetical protein